MKSATTTAFAVLVVVFVLGTYALALSLESIIGSFSKISERRGMIRAKQKATARDEDQDQGVMPGTKSSWFGLRRRRRGKVSEDEELVTEKMTFA